MNVKIDIVGLPAAVVAVIGQRNVARIRELAERYEDGLGVRKNRRVAFALYETGAVLGDPELAWKAADALEYGLGVKKSLERAKHYLEVASKFGSIGATTALAQLIWRQGKSDIDRRAAIRLYRKSAAHGEPHAMHNLGVCYSTGEGVKMNYAEASKYFRGAAERGHVEAQFKLGWCYLHGEGVRVNRRVAAAWFRKAAEHAHPQATRLLESLTQA